MPKPRPLNPLEARRTLAARFGSRVDRLRQHLTKFGLRAKRVFLVWTRTPGPEVGEGDEAVFARVEILPTPKVQDLTAITLNPFSAGKYPVGAVRVDRISTSFTFDQLSGTKVPGQLERVVPENVDFFYEIVEDGRADDPALRHRFRPYSVPDLREGKIGWSLVLERTAEDMDRKGNPKQDIDPDVE